MCPNLYFGALHLCTFSACVFYQYIGTLSLCRQVQRTVILVEIMSRIKIKVQRTEIVYLKLLELLRIIQTDNKTTIKILCKSKINPVNHF